MVFRISPAICPEQTKRILSHLTERKERLYAEKMEDILQIICGRCSAQSHPRAEQLRWWNRARFPRVSAFGETCRLCAADEVLRKIIMHARAWQMEPSPSPVIFFMSRGPGRAAAFLMPCFSKLTLCGRTASHRINKITLSPQ